MPSGKLAYVNGSVAHAREKLRIALHVAGFFVNTISLSTLGKMSLGLLVVRSIIELNAMELAKGYFYIICPCCGLIIQGQALRR